jgi:hypothetical protein
LQSLNNKFYFLLVGPDEDFYATRPSWANNITLLDSTIKHTRDHFPRALDNSHPGIISHRVFAYQLYAELETKKLELQEHESEFAKRYKENQEPEVENESKKLSSVASAAAVAVALAEKSKSKRPEKDITTSKVIKSMLNIINYPEQQFLQEYKSKTLNYDGIHFPFSIKNNRNTTELELCILQEFLLRFYDREQEEDKRWFFSPIEVLLNSI